MTNIEVYKRTKEKPCSGIIRLRRLKWIGHLMRLDEDTPARLALEEFHRKVKKPRGKQKTTWVKCANEDLNSFNFPILESAELKLVVTDRTRWRALIAKAQSLQKA